jgi:hypothetical protein
MAGALLRNGYTFLSSPPWDRPSLLSSNISRDISAWVKQVEPEGFHSHRLTPNYFMHDALSPLRYYTLVVWSLDIRVTSPFVFKTEYVQILVYRFY